MAIIYTDTTNKYDLSNQALGSASRSFTDKITGGIATYFNGIGSVIRSILPFGESMRAKNERLAAEQGSNLTADQLQTQADKATTIAVVVLVVIVAVVFFIIKKKKS